MDFTLKRSRAPRKEAPAASKDALYITKMEAAILLGISKRTFERWESSRKDLPAAVRIGSSIVRYPKSEIIAFAENLRNRRTA